MSGAMMMLLGAITSAAPTDPYWSYVTLLVPGNGTNGAQNNTFLDSSTNNFTITRNGNTTQGTYSPFTRTAPYSAAVSAGSGYFDGSGDYLTVPTTTALSFGTGDFTVEVWVYKTAAANSSIIDARVNPATASPWALYIDGSNFPYFYDGTVYTSSVAISLNTWTHIAVTRSSGTLKMFVNGVQGYSATVTTNLDRAAGAFIGVLANTGSLIAYYQGFMSGLRVVKGTAVYTSAFTPPTSPLTAITNTSLLLNFTNAGIIDNSMFNDLETVGNAQISTAVSKFGGGSVAMDGSGDYVVEPTNVSYGYGLSDFTIEFWVYFNSVSTSQTIFSNLTDAGSVNPHIYIDGGSNTIRYYVTGSDRITSSAVSSGQWYYVALCRSGTSTRLFLNGTQTGSTFTDNFNYGTSAPLGIGTYWSSGSPVTSLTLNGYMDDLRVTKGYARYTSNFTAPTAPLPTR